MGEYRKAEMIKYNRKYLHLTREALAEDICDVGTLARYEKGTVEPSAVKFARLMQRMGISGELYSLPPMLYIPTGQEKDLKGIMEHLERYSFEEVEVLPEPREIKCVLTRDYPETWQYVRRIELILAFEKEEITGTEFREGLTEALTLTFKEYNEKYFPIHRIFTETEILLINNIATQYGYEGNSEIAIRLFENLEDYFMQDLLVGDFKSRTKQMLCTTFITTSGGVLRKKLMQDKSARICFKKQKHIYGWLVSYVGYIMNLRIIIRQ